MRSKQSIILVLRGHREGAAQPFSDRPLLRQPNAGGGWASQSYVRRWVTPVAFESRSPSANGVAYPAGTASFAACDGGAPAPPSVR